MTVVAATYKKKCLRSAAYRRSGFFFQAEDGIRALTVTGVQTCALPIYDGDPVRAGPARTVSPAPAQPDREGGSQLERPADEDRRPHPPQDARAVHRDDARSEERRVGKGRR